MHIQKQKNIAGEMILLRVYMIGLLFYQAVPFTLFFDFTECCHM